MRDGSFDRISSTHLFKLIFFSILPVNETSRIKTGHIFCLFFTLLSLKDVLRHDVYK